MEKPYALIGGSRRVRKKKNFDMKRELGLADLDSQRERETDIIGIDPSL